MPSPAAAERSAAAEVAGRRLAAAQDAGHARLGGREQAPVVDARDQQHDPADAAAAQRAHRARTSASSSSPTTSAHDVLGQLAVGHDAEPLRPAQLARRCRPGRVDPRRDHDRDAGLEGNGFRDHRRHSPARRSGRDGMLVHAPGARAGPYAAGCLRPVNVDLTGSARSARTDRIAPPNVRVRAPVRRRGCVVTLPPVGASVTLVTPAVAVEPGQSVSITVKVRNTGSVVDEFVLDVLGDAAAWAAVEPPTINLFPGAEGEAKAVFRPPRAAGTPSGLVPFGLRARSREDPAGSAVEEGSVTVGAFADPHAELVPRTSRGSGSGSHDIAVDNRGNTRLSAEIEATDADRSCTFDVKPPAVVVEPGMAGFAKVKVSPAKRFWRGQPKTRPFQLFIKPEGGLPITLDGTLLQESILPPWFLKALLALLGLLILAGPALVHAAQAVHPERGVRGRRLAARQPQGRRQRGARTTPACPRWAPRTAARPPRRRPTAAPPTSRSPRARPPRPRRPHRRHRTRACIIPGLGSPIDGTLSDREPDHVLQGHRCS